MDTATQRIPQEEVRRQLDCCQEIAAITAQWPEKPLAFVDTYGCPLV